MTEITAIHADIPTDQAWKVGRRIYVVAGYKSQLNSDLRALGAKWDSDERALWVGSGKLDQVLPLIRAQAQRVEQAQAVKAEGRWVDIPYDASRIRARAKQLGGRWDRERKQWAMPTDEAEAEIRSQVETWKAQRQAARQQRKDAASRTPEEIIVASGRTATDVRGTAEGRLHGRMRRPEAEEAKPQLGDVRQLRSGDRVLVLSCTVNFMSQDDVDDLAPHLEPGWYYRYEYVVVEPTEQEQAADDRRAAERADHDEIEATFAAARQAVTGRVEPPAPRPNGATIVKRRARGMGGDDGRLTLDQDGQLHWHHPGHYDDWRASSGQIVDRAIVARVRAIVAGGARTRGHYEVQEG